MNKAVGAFKYVPLVVWSLIVIVPLLVLLLASFKTDADYIQSTPIAFPKEWTLGNFDRVIHEGHLLHALKNSLVLVVCGACGSVVLGAITAYCLNRFDFKFKKYIHLLYLAAAIVPGTMLQIMVYQVVHWLDLTGTMGAPVLIYLSTDIIQIWIYLQFLERLSMSLDESAMIDGASYLRIFRSIIFPLLLPATATVVILKSIFIYNDMFTQYLYMSSVDLMTATTALMMFTGQFASTSFNVMAAGIVLVMLPTIVLFLSLQKYIFAGITHGSVKG
ncbi:carbohydrate ABC transporter permease [Cohnella sp. GCM10027633]|uniref:carbohydrate ABC transporter permease n=1 Tax=unclassified Cohnella TaxID=2636738 RepID=UPI00362970D3